jgi:pimeloyl-ACP methyl ester carboxylesterase
MLFLFNFSTNVYSSTYFTDDFLSLDTNKWFINYNDGHAIISDGFIKLTANNNTSYTKFPFVSSVSDIIPPNGDFEINIQIRRGSLGNFGTSITLSTQLPINGFLADRNTNPSMYQKEQYISIILGKNNSKLQIAYCGDCYESVCSPSTIRDYYFPTTQSLASDLLFKISYIEKVYKIYFINVSSDPIITSFVQTSIRPTKIWFGSAYYSGGSNSWTPISIDRITVSSFISPPPLIFIPGYMASFDWDDMVNNTSNNQWQRNPVEKVYNNFWDTLKDLGYSDTPSGNLQRWDYDFRRPLPEISAKFKTWFDSYLATQSPDTKVTLVGHSFGGLIARQYLKDNPVNMIDKLITVGTPHEGVLDTYPMFAAGVSGTSDISQKVIFETIMRWHGKNFLTKKQVVQNVIPSAQDLIPIFSSGFLKNASAQNINSIFINTNLTALKNTSVTTTPIQIIRGSGLQTKEFYKLIPRSFLDQILNDWPDGKIDSTEYSNQGDNTVLTKSSNITGIETFEIAEASHTDIITEPDGIRKILEYAGIPCDNCTIVDNPVAAAQNAILLLLKSPAEIKVKDLITNQEIGAGASAPLINNAITAYNNKFIYIPTDDQKRYAIEVNGTGTGGYQLDVGSLATNSSSSFLTFNKQAEAGKVDVYQVQYEQNGNLIHLIDTEIINPYDSAKKILSGFEQTPLVTNLIMDCNLIKQLVEINHDYPNALRQIQKMLIKTFSLRETIADANQRNFTLDLLKMEREMFKIVNNQSGKFNMLHAQNSSNMLNQILNAEEIKLAVKQNLSETDAASFKTAREFQEAGSRELAANLAGQSYFTSQISRFFANESL